MSYNNKGIARYNFENAARKKLDYLSCDCDRGEIRRRGVHFNEKIT
jgi:hypothetical protein